MKISCQSCQAKYTIADEKVLGKIVKIRCKKCGATIVINGNETGATTTSGSVAEGQSYDYAAAATGDQWTVNVADGDQRTMSLDELVTAYKSGTINEETYCWKDGMGDWLPIREISELSAAVGGSGAMGPDQTHQDQSAASPPYMPPAAHHDEHEEPTAAAYPGYGAGAAASSNGNGASAALFGGGAAPAAARRTGARGGGGMDLFGNVTHAGGEDDVMTSAPVGMPEASGDPGKLTGQRNENSVLFSLSALTSNGPKEEAPAAPGEGSGLIDIRALSASMGDKGPEKKSHVDDIMNLGGGGAFSAALAAPVLAPPTMDGGGLDLGGQRKDNTKLIVFGIVGAGALVALAIILVFVLKKPTETQTTVPTASAMPTDTAGTAAPVAVAAADTTQPGAAVAPSPNSAAAPGTGQVPSGDAPKRGGGGGGGGGGGAHAKAASNNDTPAAPKAFTPPPAAAPAAGGNSLDKALQQSVGSGASPAAPAAAAQSSAPFDRGAAQAALGSVNVTGCKKSDGPTGSGHVKITFGSSGSVSSAVVDQPPFAGTAVGGCVAGKFRSAHVPAFGGSPVTVGKSFIIE